MPQEKDTKNKPNSHVLEKVIILSLALIVAGLLFYFFKDVFIPFIRLEIAQDLDGAKAFLIEKGFLGCVTVTLIEALQMVVIFIPAEFIQLSSGMSYPWWLALILCDLGVIFGSSVIFFLVRVFKFNGNVFGKRTKLEKYDKKRAQTEKNVMILMYFLFFMPIIPFGAICYYAANKKIRYHKYVFTCATGVIPSIFTSIIMGTAVKEFITNALPIWLLILIIILAAAILFAFIYFILKKFYFKEFDGTPDSPFYSLAFKLVKLYLFGKCRIKVDEKSAKAVGELDGAYLMLVNHGSDFDFYYATRLAPEKRFAIVMNRHIFNNKKINKYAKKMGVIPKKIFSPDVETIKSIMKATAHGYPVLMMPEGRLSTAGYTNPISPVIAKLVKKLRVPVVLVNVENAYLVKPKWRKKYMKSDVFVSVSKILTVDDIDAADENALFSTISSALFVDNFEKTPPLFRQKGKAKGLENVLYACPRCGTLYSTYSENDSLHCSACKTEYPIDERYLFRADDYKNIRDYYHALENMEEKTLDDVNLSFRVNVKIFHKNDNEFDSAAGIFTFCREKMTFTGDDGGESFEILTRDLEGIAYSAGEEFEFYRNDRLYYFYPENNGKLCARIALLFDLIKRKTIKTEKTL